MGKQEKMILKHVSQLGDTAWHEVTCHQSLNEWTAN